MSPGDFFIKGPVMTFFEAIHRDLCWIENLSRLYVMKHDPKFSSLTRFSQPPTPSDWGAKTLRPFLLLCIYHMRASIALENQNRFASKAPSDDNSPPQTYDDFIRPYVDFLGASDFREFLSVIDLDLDRRMDEWSMQALITDFMASKVCPMLSASSDACSLAFDYSGLEGGDTVSVDTGTENAVLAFLGFQTPCLDRNLRLESCGKDHFNALSIVAKGMLKALRLTVINPKGATPESLKSELDSLFKQYPAHLGTAAPSLWNFSRLTEILQEAADATVPS